MEHIIKFFDHIGKELGQETVNTCCLSEGNLVHWNDKNYKIRNVIINIDADAVFAWAYIE